MYVSGTWHGELKEHLVRIDVLPVTEISKAEHMRFRIW